MKSLSILAVLPMFIACSSPHTKKEFSTKENAYLRLVDEYIVPHGYSFRETTVGGLSGIDELGDEYVIISDDASRYQAPRFYKTAIDLKDDRIDAITFNEVVFFYQEGDTEYTDIRSADSIYVDPEAIRISGDKVYWSSEGFRQTRFFDPLVLMHSVKGYHLRTYETDTKYATSIDQVGPRHNASFEGLTLEEDGDHLWVNAEAPLMQDGAIPSATNGGAPIRISRINEDNGQIDLEFGYQLEPIFVKPDSGAFAMNGAVELLWLEEGKILVLERSYVAGAGNRVRLFRADYAEATDTKSITSLTGQTLQLATKTLLLDFDDLPVDKIDNVEGVCWGPKLDNGNNTLIFVADDNFSASQINQFLLVEILKPLTI